MVVVGITGQFASGKTTAANMFKKLKARVIDVDKLGHKALKGIDKKLYRRRKALAKEVFSDREKLENLCRRLHPVMAGRIKQILSDARKKKGRRVYVLDAAVLIEMGLLNEVDYLVVVKSSRAVQVRRAKKKWGLRRQEIISRIKSQMSVRDSLEKADFAIDNSGTLSSMKKQVKEIWNNIN